MSVCNKKISFMGKEYKVDTFDIEAMWDHGDDWTKEQEQEYLSLCPDYKYVKTGEITWNGDNQYFENTKKVITDERYI